MSMFAEHIREDVLDHGFIELIDMMGDDREPARAARISYSDGVERTASQDQRLSLYLLANGHTTPFEMVQLKWRVKLPIFVARQWVRHRTASINEFSMRYADPERLSESDDVDFYVPKVWRRPDADNKQGSIPPEVREEENENAWLSQWYIRDIKQSISRYHWLINSGVANEQARMILPVSVYTEWIWLNDLHNTLHFLDLRDNEHAQWEIQQYAKAMKNIMHAQLPELMKIWEDIREHPRP